MSLVFDTLKLSKSLERAFTPEQAEVLTEALTLSATEHLATKADLALIESELKVEIAGLRTELKGDISSLRADMIRWIVGAIAFNLVAQAGVTVAIAKLIVQH